MREKGTEGQRDRGIAGSGGDTGCEMLRRRLQDYVTRELEPEKRREVDAHLVECGDCQRELALMTSLVSVLDHQPVEQPSTGFTGKVLASLPRQRRFVPSPWWSLALVPVLAGIAWLFRLPLERGIVGWAERLGVGNVAVPAVSLQQAGIAAAVVALVGMAVAVSAGAYVWKAYLRD